MTGAIPLLAEAWPKDKDKDGTTRGGRGWTVCQSPRTSDANIRKRTPVVAPLTLLHIHDGVVCKVKVLQLSQAAKVLHPCNVVAHKPKELQV